MSGSVKFSGVAEIGNEGIKKHFQNNVKKIFTIVLSVKNGQKVCIHLFTQLTHFGE